jgi:hypothetical protein
VQYKKNTYELVHEITLSDFVGVQDSWLGKEGFRFESITAMHNAVLEAAMQEKPAQYKLNPGIQLMFGTVHVQHMCCTQSCVLH